MTIDVSEEARLAFDVAIQRFIGRLHKHLREGALTQEGFEDLQEYLTSIREKLSLILESDSQGRLQLGTPSEHN